MTTIGETPGEEVMATAPVMISNEVADYTHVPPAPEGESSTLEAPNCVKPSSGENISPHKQQDWDYGQKGGADFNMEAPIMAEDVIRAGGLGARDDLDRFLPTAVDATDYEESLMEAMEYEDVQPAGEGEIPRPGVGFVKSEQQRSDGFREVQQE
ncbi:unnamed protein product [Calypogeia fissa]